MQYATCCIRRIYRNTSKTNKHLTSKRKTTGCQYCVQSIIPEWCLMDDSHKWFELKFEILFGMPFMFPRWNEYRSKSIRRLPYRWFKKRKNRTNLLLFDDYTCWNITKSSTCQKFEARRLQLLFFDLCTFHFSFHVCLWIGPLNLRVSHISVKNKVDVKWNHIGQFPLRRWSVHWYSMEFQMYGVFTTRRTIAVVNKWNDIFQCKTEETLPSAKKQQWITPALNTGEWIDGWMDGCYITINASQ